MIGVLISNGPVEKKNQIKKSKVNFVEKEDKARAYLLWPAGAASFLYLLAHRMYRYIEDVVCLAHLLFIPYPLFFSFRRRRRRVLFFFLFAFTTVPSLSLVLLVDLLLGAVVCGARASLLAPTKKK
jgi:hypothetical protein